jgi:putative DNA methylase
LKFGHSLINEFERIALEFVRRAEPKFRGLFPSEPAGTQVLGYLWARTIRCPYCEGLVPLSPNWRLAADGTGARLKTHLAAGPGSAGRVCEFEIVRSAKDQFPGTVADGDGTCPYSDCGRVIDGDEIKQQAQAGQMGDQLYAVVFKHLIETRTKSGKLGRDKWHRAYRARRPEDDNSALVAARLAEKMPEWEALDIVPSERFPEQTNDDRPIQYGMPFWRDMFSPRQLIGHGTSVEIYRELLAEEQIKGTLSPLTQAAFVYLALSLDKLRDYNSRMARWHSKREVMVNTFDRHDFAFKWSFAEMAPLIVGLGFDWVIGQTAKCLRNWSS